MCVFDVYIVDTYVASYEGRHPQHILSQHKQHKKRKNFEAFIDKQKYFTLIVLSVHGVMGRETKAETKQLAMDMMKNGRLNTWKHAAIWTLRR